MGRSSHTQTPASVGNSVVNAEVVIQELAAGKLSASSPAVAGVKAQLLADLRGHSAQRQAQASEHLSALYDRLDSRQERWDLAAQVVSSGSAGAKILDQGFKHDVPLDLKRIAELPLDLQLGAFVDFLVSLLSVLPRGDSAIPPAGPGPQIPPPIPLEPVRRKEDDPSDPPTDLQNLLADDTQPASVRLAAAKQLGALAVPILEQMIGTSDVSREIAAQALLALSSTDARPAVGHALEHMAKNHRAFVDHLRAQIRAASQGAGDHCAAWARSSQHAAIPDAWLRDAVARCDCLGILQAGTGREVVAIPMVVRRCAELYSPEGGSA